MKKFIYILAAMTLIGRIFITPRLMYIPSMEGTYEALAHLFVGFLILVPFYDKEQTLGPSKMYGWIGWGLGLWELGWFLVQKYGV